MHDTVDEDGAVMAEYGLVLVGIAAACALAVAMFGARLFDLFGAALGLLP